MSGKEAHVKLRIEAVNNGRRIENVKKVRVLIRKGRKLTVGILFPFAKGHIGRFEAGLAN
jgi:hypothetical protein